MILQRVLSPIPRRWLWLGCALLTALLLALAFWFYQGAAPRAPANNDYESPPAYPKALDTFSLQQHQLFADPMNGLGLRYHSAQESLQFDINIYPIGGLNWQPSPHLFDGELQVILADRQYAVSQGQWLSHQQIIRQPVWLAGSSGMQLHGWLTGAQMQRFDVVYLFIQQDKWIKFSFFNDHTGAGFPPQSGFLHKTQQWVERFLPHIQAPPESPYARQQRELHSQKIRAKAQELLKARQAP
jgi:hypothetical protein